VLLKTHARRRIVVLVGQLSPIPRVHVTLALLALRRTLPGDERSVIRKFALAVFEWA
jgi:hypothetical protein